MSKGGEKTMTSNVYESAVLINAALDDEQINGIITRIKEFMVTNGGEIREIENWGRKRLAYMVKKSKIGYYAIFRFSAPANIISKLERFYVLDEHILRFLTISLDKDALEYLENKTAQRMDAEASAEKNEKAKDTTEVAEAKETNT
jgi:small subunit ribosomal protein S6